jgi:hypothetical protein
MHRRYHQADAHGGSLMSFYRRFESVILKGDQGVPIAAYVAKPGSAG